MTQPLRVLVLYRPSGPLGGDTKVARQFATALEGYGVSVTIQGGDKLDNVRLFDVVHIVGAVDVPWTFAASITLIRENVPYTTTPFYYPRDARQKYYGGHPDTLPGYTNTIAFVLQQSFAIAAPTMSELRECWNIAPEKRGFVMGYGFEPPEYELQERERENFVLCVGRIERHKNQAALAQACIAVGLPLVCVGEIKDSEYAGLIGEFGGDVRGIVEQDELYRLFETARIHALPSFGECVAQANCEAAWFGVPQVIGLGHDWEYFKDRAEYCDPSDWRSIARALARASWRKRKRWTSQPSWNDVAMNYLAWIEENLER